MQAVEIFTGAGGLAMGLQSAGFSHAGLIERDKHSCTNIRHNKVNGYTSLRHWNLLESDVREIDYSIFGTDVQLVAGGPPCQPFSLGGKHQAYNDDRDMFPEAVRAVRELRPSAFVFENVKGLLRKSFATYFSYILLRLMYPEQLCEPTEEWTSHLSRLEKIHSSGKECGLRYNVIFRLLNAADYGIPQSRHRVIIVGFRNDLGISWTFPEPTHSRDALTHSKWVSGEYWDEHKIAKTRIPHITKPEKNRAEILKTYYQISLLPSLRWQTVRDAIGNLPNPQLIKHASIPNHEFRPGAKSYPGHTGSPLDEPSKTIKAGDHGVPGGENTVILDDGTIRYYTVRESARIQTFPDEYLFCGSWTENMRQIGNAVPVKLATLIGKSVIRRLGEVT